MAAFAGDYDDASEDESPGPLLPPEDRLWRHPSEVGGALAYSLDPITIRRRWQAREPSRASVWTAGLVGALLATGLVVMGTHLVDTAFPNQPAHAGAPVTPETTAAISPSSASSGDGLGSSQAAAIARVGQAIVVLDVVSPSGELRCLGVVIGGNGTLLTSAAALTGATSVLVTTAQSNVTYVGTIEGSDPSSGLAVLHISGSEDLPIAPMAGSAMHVSELALAVTAPNGASHALGSVRSAALALDSAGDRAVDAIETDLPAAMTPPGTPLLDSSGDVAAIVTGSSDGYAFAEPAWLAQAVARQLATTGVVRHGWLGINGSTEPRLTPQAPAGVRVVSVDPHTPAAQASITAGDVITSLDGHAVATMADLQGRLYVLRPGVAVTIGVAHGHVRRVAHVTLDDH